MSHLSLVGFNFDLILFLLPVSCFSHLFDSCEYLTLLPSKGYKCNYLHQDKYPDPEKLTGKVSCKQKQGCSTGLEDMDYMIRLTDMSV